jgi:molecular chaperone DnaK (HSP70)
VIPRNTTLPIKRMQMFETSVDGQTSVTCDVFEGERPMQADNHLLGRFVVTGLSPKPKGHHKIGITLTVKDNEGKPLTHCIGLVVG